MRNKIAYFEVKKIVLLIIACFFVIMPTQNIFSSSLSFEEESKRYIGTYSATPMSFVFNASGYNTSYSVFPMVCNDAIINEIMTWDLRELLPYTVNSPTITISVDREMADSLKIVIVDQYGESMTIGKRTLISDHWFPSIEGAKALIYMETGIEEAFHLSPDGRWLVWGGVVLENKNYDPNDSSQAIDNPNSTGNSETTGIITVEGSSGGFVFYDCDADNDSGNADGLISSECGWRYLEAAPADLRVVGGVPTVDSTIDGYTSASSKIVFGIYRLSDSSADRLYVNGKTKYSESNCTGTTIGTGKTNTNMLVATMGDEAYSLDYGPNKTGNYAARLCDILEYMVDGECFDDWFLPSKDELDLMYKYWKNTGLGGFTKDYYWSSSESDTGAPYVMTQSFSKGYQSIDGRYHEDYVRPIRAF